MANLLKGVPVGNSIAQELESRINLLTSKGITPTVAVVRLGENPDDIFYESSVEKKFKKYGLGFTKITMPKETSEQELINKILEINNDDSIHGVLMMRPLPSHINEKKVCDTLSPIKDSDGITSLSMSKLYSGEKNVFAPCTAVACIEMLKYYNIPITSKNVVVLGRSLVIGKPVSMLLLGENATVTICHSKTNNIEDISKKADIIISAIGKANYLKESFISSNQTVIDVGINYDKEGNLCGDADFANISEKVENISPVPGGVGSITTSVLMRHVIESAEKMQEK